MLGVLWQALSLLPSCFMVFIFLYYQHGQHEEGVTIIESLANMKQSDPLGGPLLSIAHY
jgi:hypothetical protein